MALPHAVPAVSVIIPAYNAAAFIAEAVQSVRAQTFRDFEIIVVDDGSTDGTDEVVRRLGPGVRYHRQPNRGVAAARNAGIELSRGDLVCFLDADDLWMPDKLARQTAFMAAHPDIGLLFADATESHGDVVQKASIVASMRCGAAIASQVPIEGAFRKLLVENFVPTSSVMLRRVAVATAGLFDVTLPNVEDRDMWLRIAAHFPIACLPQVLVRKRSHGANISTRIEVALRARIRVWQQCRDRFPALAPAALCNQLTAVTYQELGYILLGKGDGRGARRCAVASLGCAARAVAATRSPFAYGWLRSMAILPLSFVRWRLVQGLAQLRNAVLKRNTTSVSAA
jgi:GT2 family glycosyltransferase